MLSAYFATGLQIKKMSCICICVALIILKENTKELSQIEQLSILD
jgi:hypothetical protein